MRKRITKAAYFAAGVVVASSVAWLVIHRHVVAAAIKGGPLPDPPASHGSFFDGLFA